MTTRIETAGPSSPLRTGPSAYRTTATPHRPFQSVMSAGASAVVSGAEAAVTELPGGPILAASFRSAPSGELHQGLGPRGSSSAPAGSAPDGSPIAAGGEPKVEQMLAQTADQNLYYLQLQEQMAAENRQYSALSNVLRARHETVKNAIGNIR